MTEGRLKYVAGTVVPSQNGQGLHSLRSETGSRTELLKDVTALFAVGDDVVIISRADFDTLSDIFQEQMK